jgi:hypothetical protein
MFRREKTIYIAAAPEALFHYVADIRRHGEWGAQIWNITLEPGSEHGPGTTFAGSDQKGLFGRSLIRIVAEEPPVRFVYDCLDYGGAPPLVNVAGREKEMEHGCVTSLNGSRGHGGCAWLNRSSSGR